MGVERGHDRDRARAMNTHLDVAEVLHWVGRIASDDDARDERIAAVLAG